MNINVIINARMPTQKAHGIQVMNLCQAFARAGNKTTLIIPRRLNQIKEDEFDYYGVEKIFKIVRLPCIDLISCKFLGNWGYRLQSLSFGFFVFFWCLFFTKRKDVFYSREQICFFPILYIRPNCYFEMHDFPGKCKIHNIFYKKIKCIVATNQWKTDQIIKRFNLPKDKIIVYPNAVNIEKFDIDLNKEDARKKLNFPFDKKIIMYTGHLFGWKGPDTLLMSLKHLEDEDMVIYFIGGMDEDRERLEKFAKENSLDNRRFKFFSHQKHEMMPIFLKAADVLVLPNTAKEDISKFYMGGPLKLVEYMSARRPVVASDLVSVRNVVDDSDVLFFEPDNSESLARAIKRLFIDNDLALNFTTKARQDVEYYSWKNRINAILDFINKL